MNPQTTFDKVLHMRLWEHSVCLDGQDFLADCQDFEEAYQRLERADWFFYALRAIFHDFDAGHYVTGWTAPFKAAFGRVPRGSDPFDAFLIALPDYEFGYFNEDLNYMRDNQEDFPDLDIFLAEMKELMDRIRDRYPTLEELKNALAIPEFFEEDMERVARLGNS